MGIDRIGPAGGGVALPPVTGPAEPASGVTDSFQVVSRQVAQPVGRPELLQRLQSGEITLDHYLDLHVEQATAHLASSVNSERLQFIRSALRSQLESDPMLVELAQRATGGQLSGQDGG